MTMERTISLDTLFLEVYQDENAREHIRIVRKGLKEDFPGMDFAKGDEAAAFAFMSSLAKLCGVEITYETKSKNVVSVAEKPDNPTANI